MTITVYFSLDTGPGHCAGTGTEQGKLAAPQLPDAVTKYGVSVQKNRQAYS